MGKRSVAFLRQYTESELWVLREYLKAAGNLALAGGCDFGILFLQSNQVAVPLWTVVVVWFCAAVNFLNGLLDLKVYFDNARDARSAFLRSFATVLLAPIVGAVLGALILAVISGWIP